MTGRLSDSDIRSIAARYEAFSGPPAEQMKFEDYSELYDKFVGEDLPKLFEHLRLVEREKRAGRG